MSTFTYIYNINGNIKLLDTLNYTLEEFKANPVGCYPGWNNVSMYASDTEFSHPLLMGDGSIREKTQDELKLEGLLELSDGEYIEGGVIKTVPTPENLLKKVWDKVTHAWREGATDQELKEYYFNLINKYKAEILEVGFDFKTHQQKCRERDLALLGNAIAANEDAQPFATVPVTHWSFNDHDVVEMSLDELKKLRIDGATFVQAVFIVEAQLKAAQSNILLKKQEVIKKIDELSTVKCFKQDI